MTAARLMGFDMILCYSLGRFFNLLFFAVCIWFAIKRTPRFKLLLGMVALFPMTIHQAASLSYDCVIDGMAFLLIASLFKAMWEEGKLPAADYLMILITGALLAPAKIIYTPIVGMLLFVPYRRFGSRGKKALAVGVVYAACVAMVLATRWEVVASTFGLGQEAAKNAGEISYNWEGGICYSYRDFVTDPLRILYVYANSILRDGLSYCLTAVGVSLSGLSLPISRKLVFLIALAALLALPSDKKSWDTGLSRAASLTIACLVTLLVMTAMMTGWTSNTRDVIQGVQGRYLTPIIPLALAPLAFRLRGWTEERKTYLLLPVAALEWGVILNILTYTMYH